MAVVMVLSLCTSLFVTNVSAATDPKEISKVIVDFRSSDALELSGGSIYKHAVSASEPDPLTAGKVSFENDKGAMQVQHHVVKKDEPYRVMFCVNNTKRLTEDLKYFVVVYQAKASGTYDLTLWNTPQQGNRVVIKDDGGDTAGKWVVSDAFDISTVSADGKSIQKRWIAGTINTLSFVTTDENCEFYIKEVGFFKSPEDAKAYYLAVDLEKNPAEYMSDAEKKAAGYGDGSDTVEEEDLSLLPEPVFMRFEGLMGMVESNTQFNDFADNTEGLYGLTTAPDGTRAVKLDYSPNSNFAPYRMMPSFTKKDLVTDKHGWVRITYLTEDPVAAQIVLSNNGLPNDKAVLVNNTGVSQGKWVTSNAVYIATAGMLTRYINGQHCTVGYTSSLDTGSIYIKEIGFFASEKQAYAYYGDEPPAGASSYSVMKFDASGTTGAIVKGNNYGNAEVDNNTRSVVIKYADTTNHGVHYMAKLRFTDVYSINSKNMYMRVYYSAKNPKNESGIRFVVVNDKTFATDIISSDLQDTNGKFVLSDTVKLNTDTFGRFSGTNGYSGTTHNSFNISANGTDGEYVIKAVYFFPSEKAANEFVVPEETDTTLTICGNDISKYQIVVPTDTPLVISVQVEALADYIFALTGVKVPVVTDDAAETPYEIVVGKTNRKLSTELHKEYDDDESASHKCAVKTENGKIYITSAMPFAIEAAMKTFMTNFLYYGSSYIPETIAVYEGASFSTTYPRINVYDKWASATNVLDPEVYTEDFDTDDGYFTEENAADNFIIANGVMSTKATDNALTYIHVYEQNVNIKADLTYSGKGEFGLMARYTSADAWVKAGYDTEAGEWYIKSREGADFYIEHLATEKMALAAGKTYNVELKVNGDIATLFVDGKQVAMASGFAQVTPGRVAIYADGVALTVDNFELTLVSGMGTIWRNVAHTLLPGEEYREGGSVFEMNDGTLNYTHHSGANFKSTDNGKTWQAIEPWTTYAGYVNMLRLVDGSLMKVSVEGAYMYSYTSTDEGKTWTRGGKITDTKFRADTTINASAVNMNDKINQSANGTIFYCQNYETTTHYFEENGDGVQRKVFCEFFFSKDNGNTWTKSDTATWTIEGNETQTHFGECKIVECADGTIRMYNSWNYYDCIVYSDSTDGGKTFGPLQMMPEFHCGCSSMQFYRDPYGETDTTYYMIWINTQDNPIEGGMPRSSISLAKSIDGKSWTFLGDVWRWQSNYRYGSGALLNHVVDPFVKTNKDYIIIGTGLDEHLALAGDHSYHGAQRQHIWSIKKDTLGDGTPISGIEYAGSFKDVHSGHSFYDAVKFVVAEGLFNGTSETTFEPYTAMNRAMFVTVLGRLDKADVSKYTTPTFDDVAPGQWYTSYVEWAAANGIVNGMGGGKYGVTGEITVEQACTILYRYASGKTGTTPSGKTVSDFTDASDVSDWAAEAVEWAVSNGVYSGNGTHLNPKVSASRAVVATMFANYVKAFA